MQHGDQQAVVECLGGLEGSPVLDSRPRDVDQDGSELNQAIDTNVVVDGDRLARSVDPGAEQGQLLALTCGDNRHDTIERRAQREKEGADIGLLFGENERCRDIAVEEFGVAIGCSPNLNSIEKSFDT